MPCPPTSDADGVDHVDGPVAWREAGSGPPVVLLHGLGGGRTAWGPQLRGLADRFRCLAWDLPGYGDSEPLPRLGWDTIADALVGWLDDLGLDRVDLVGLSFGGMHALHTALRHPDRIRRLVLADTSPAFGLDGTTAEDWTAARLAVLDDGGTPGDQAEAVVDAITAVRLDGAVRREVVGAFGRISPAGFRAAVELLPSNDVRGRLHEIAHPALVVVGELDAETPPSYARVLADGLPDARLVILDGVGHLSPSEAPDRFNELVVDFLADPDPTGAPA